MEKTQFKPYTMFQMYKYFYYATPPLKKKCVEKFQWTFKWQYSYFGWEIIELSLKIEYLQNCDELRDHLVCPFYPTGEEIWSQETKEII